jgi:hypothetical protein
MNTINKLLYISSVCIVLAGTSCETRKTEDVTTTFTEADSLTEIYLDLQDSILLAWNQMINDDNQKIKAMYNLLHELQISAGLDPEQTKSLEQRIKQLKQIRYTPKTMWNNEVIDEYDFASNSLVAELIAMSESHSAYSYNTTMQKLVEQIRTADQRIENYRQSYDAIVIRYNQFLSENKHSLKEVDVVGKLEEKPLFQMVSE